MFNIKCELYLNTIEIIEKTETLTLRFQPDLSS